MITPPFHSDWLDHGGALDAAAAASTPPSPPSRWILKSVHAGHPVRGHDDGPLSASAASTMLPQSEYEVAQQVVAPPTHPTALGDKGALR